MKKDNAKICTVLVTTPAHNQIDYDASEENVEYVTLDETL